MVRKDRELSTENVKTRTADHQAARVGVGVEVVVIWRDGLLTLHESAGCSVEMWEEESAGRTRG